MIKEDPRIFVNITRVDEDARMVYGYGSREDIVDSYGTIIDLDSVKNCMDTYMEFPALREMHQMQAAGKTVEYTIDDVGVMLGAKVVDDSAWNKVKEGVYRGFSIGGKKAKEVDNRIFLKSITEFSLVDSPSNAGCTIDSYRIKGDDEMSKKEAPKPAEAEVKRAEVPYADELNKHFPVDTVRHCEAALAILNKSKLPAEEVEVMRGKVTAALEALLTADEKIQRGNWDEITGRYITDEIDDCQTALYALSSLMQLQTKEVAEGISEQVNALQSAISAIKDFIASEIMENEIADDVTAGAGAEDDTTRKGAAISGKNLERIQAMHDHSAALGAKCQECNGGDVAKADGEDDDVQRLAGLEEEVKRLSGQNEDLVKRVKELEAEPAPAKGKLIVVERGQDIASAAQAAADEEIKRIESLPPEQQAVELVRRAQATPVFLGR